MPEEVPDKENDLDELDEAIEVDPLEDDDLEIDEDEADLSLEDDEEDEDEDDEEDELAV